MLIFIIALFYCQKPRESLDMEAVAVSWTDEIFESKSQAKSAFSQYENSLPNKIPPKKSLRIMTFNVAQLSGSMAQKTSKIVQIVDPDIFVTQEVPFDHRLDDALSADDFMLFHGEPPKPRCF